MDVRTLAAYAAALEELEKRVTALPPEAFMAYARTRLALYYQGQWKVLKQKEN